ncbi:hypothetical protein Tco_0700752 [Tanacetum coccineum]
MKLKKVQLESLKKVQLQLFRYLEDQDHLRFSLCCGSKTEDTSLARALVQLGWQFQVIFVDTVYGSSQIRRIGNWSNALSCEVLALIRRISFVGYSLMRMEWCWMKNNCCLLLLRDFYKKIEPTLELTEREQKIDEQLRIIITDRNIKEESLKKELHSVKMKLNSTIGHNKLMREESALYNGHEIVKTHHVPAIVHHSEDTLELAETTRKKMNEKMKDPMCVKKKVKIIPPE